jgi:hypothetical protein
MTQEQKDELIRIKTILWEVANELETDGKKCASRIIFLECEKIHELAMLPSGGKETE